MSITSMTNRARMAENLTIDQLKQSIQDGVVPSYIGVPLLKSKVEDAKLLQAAKAAQSMGQQPSVAQQIMSQAQQVSQPEPQMAPQAGVEGLSTNLPAAMAGGGIVAFAEGGMYDEEDSDEERQDAARQAEMDEMMDEYAQSFQNGIGQLPAAQQFAPASEGKEDASDFVARIMHKESRGRRYGKDGQLLTSEKGAQGEMQVMPGTSRDPGFGVKPARDDSPDELARVGRDYANTLLARYKDPKLAAIAYNMGPGATDKWLAAGADMSKLPKETQGYVQGFAGGGEVKHFYEGDAVKERKRQIDLDRAEMMKPIAAAGDIPAGFWNGLAGLTESGANAIGVPRLGRALGIYDPDVTSVEVPKIGNGSATPYFDKYVREAQANAGKDMSAKADTKETPKAETKPEVKPVAKGPTNYDMASDSADQSFGVIPRGDGKGANASAMAMEQAAKADPYAEFKDLFAKREENLAKQREQDKYMAMLQAGLGMMGGTSQHALANIGAGATQGIQSLAQANAARTAEENALLSGRLGLAKIGSNKEYQDAMMAYRKELSDKTDARARDLAAQNIAEKTAGRTERDEAKALQRLSDISKNAEIQAEKAIAANPAMNFAQDREAKKQAMIADILRRNAAYAKTYRGVHGPDADPFEGLGGTMGADYGSIPEGAVRKVK